MDQISHRLATDLNSVVSIFPEVKEKIEKEMLWGIFFEKLPYEIPFQYDEMFSIPYSIVQASRSAIGQLDNRNFFAPGIEEALQGKQVIITLDYEDCDAETYFRKEKTPVILDQSMEIIVSPTLPDAEMVFSDLIQGNIFEGEKNTWLFEYMDLYDEARYQIMEKLYRYYYQIGGHGRWIQGDYNGRYIAQVNNGIGDAGSVFVTYTNNKFLAWVDMY